MIIRQARESDFAHLETFVWQAVFPALDRDGLSEDQRAENDELVEGARTRMLAALNSATHGVFVAIEPKSRTLAGYVVVDAAPRAYAEVSELIVKRSYWGKGVGESLLDEALNFIGYDRAVSLAVRHYNARALAFFQKHGFEDTGETTGDHAIPRTLLLREAGEPAPEKATETTPDFDDFPTAADEPVFAELPDYRLTVDDSEPLFAPGTNALRTVEEPEDDGETTLSETQLSELEAFIARARAKKAGTANPVSAEAPKTNVRPVTRKSPRSVPLGEEIELDVAPKAPARKPAFSFDFAETPAGPSTVKGATATAGTTRQKTTPIEQVDPVTEDTTTASPDVTTSSTRKGGADPIPAESSTSVKTCPDCDTELPVSARFCFSCGFPQPESGGAGTVERTEPAVSEDALVLEAVELPAEDTAEDEVLELNALDEETNNHTPASSDAISLASAADKVPTGERNSKRFTLSELKAAFRDHLQERVTAYFGTKKVADYLKVLESNHNFQQLRDGSLTSLQQWINSGEQTVAAATERLESTLADLTEYFIVETAGELSGGVLPQRLLRHQSVDWDTVDLFRLVMDYLDFTNETELVYTDFVAMPTRALRNATAAFLHAGKDERIFFICDQSLISAAKNGFAVTDSGLYWKNVLQPAGSVLFNELEDVRIKQGHLELDRQFFNAGSSLNLKMAVLLDKLRRRRA